MIRRYTNHRQRRKQRIRARIKGTMTRPRLSVFKSNRYLYAQLIDDIQGKTLAAVSNAVKTPAPSKGERIRTAGKLLSQKALKLGITSLVFDRSGYKYHGRVKIFAEAVREGGLKF